MKLKQIFEEIDSKRDSIIDFSEYSSALERNPNLLNWFSLLNNETAQPQPKPAKPKQDVKADSKTSDKALHDKA